MPPVQTIAARYSLLSVQIPGEEPLTAGVLLEDPSQNRLYIRIRRDWSRILPEHVVEDDVAIIESLEVTIQNVAQEMGAAEFLTHVEDKLSNVVLISDRKQVVVGNFDRALGRLYREHVASTVQQFVTHLPRYSLAAAAGPFLENREIEAEGWEEAPAGLRLAPGMFVATVTGRSMQPLIPDGALCVFRSGVTGSRQGKLVLVEARGENDKYTVKRYFSQKGPGEDPETWRHNHIRLEPLNPEFAAWNLDPEEDRYQIVAEFVQVLD